jgi:PAS domain-containing protein
MTEGRGDGVDPSDEYRHPVGDDPLWNESYYLDFVNDGDGEGDGTLAGYVRIGLYPNLGVTWWTAMVVGRDRPMVASVAYDRPVSPGELPSMAAPGPDVTVSVGDPLGTMRLRGTAPGAVHRDPAALYRTEPGDPTTVGWDLEWTTDGLPYHYQVTTRYEVPCLVAGEVTVGGERLVVRGSGQRDHSWGVRDWWAFGWCWAAVRLDDGTRVHIADIRMPGQGVALGYIQPGDGTVSPVSSLEVTEELGSDGLPRRARAVVEPGGFDLAIEPLAFGPVLLTATDGRTTRFPRAAARFTDRDGRSGVGWIEWNQPDRPDTGR